MSKKEQYNFAIELLPIIKDLDFSPKNINENYKTVIVHHNGFTFSILKMYHNNKVDVLLRRINTISNTTFINKRIENYIVIECWLNVDKIYSPITINNNFMSFYNKSVKKTNFCHYCNNKKPYKNGIDNHLKTKKHHTHLKKYMKNFVEVLLKNTKLNYDVINEILSFVY